MYMKITHRQHHIESLSVMIFHSFFYFVANIFASTSTKHYSSYHFYHLSRWSNPSEPIKQLLKKKTTLSSYHHHHVVRLCVCGCVQGNYDGSAKRFHFVQKSNHLESFVKLTSQFSVCFSAVVNGTKKNIT